LATIRYMLCVNAPVQRAFKSWVDLEGLEKYFAFIERIEHKEGVWLVQYQGLFRAAKISFQLTENVDERVIGWKSNSGVTVSGSLSFEPAGAKTYVTVTMSYDPPAKRIGDMISEAFGYPANQIEEGLQAWAEAMEKS